MQLLSRAPVRSLANHFHDAWLGISTTGTAPAEAADHVYYATVSYPCTQTVLDRLALTPADVFVDVGCGKGRVVCLAAKTPVREVIGVEYSPSLAATAERNAGSMRGRRAPVEIVCQSAETFDYSRATVLYFFNPFEPPLLDAVLTQVHHDRAGKPTRMAFVMASLAQREVFAQHDWLQCYSQFDDEDGHPVLLYRSIR